MHAASRYQALLSIIIFPFFSLSGSAYEIDADALMLLNLFFSLSSPCVAAAVGTEIFFPLEKKGRKKERKKERKRRYTSVSSQRVTHALLCKEDLFS